MRLLPKAKEFGIFELLMSTKLFTKGSLTAIGGPSFWGN